MSSRNACLVSNGQSEHFTLTTIPLWVTAQSRTNQTRPNPLANETIGAMLDLETLDQEFRLGLLCMGYTDLDIEIHLHEAKLERLKALREEVLAQKLARSAQDDKSYP